jgi:hypothetical protein
MSTRNTLSAALFAFSQQKKAALFASTGAISFLGWAPRASTISNVPVGFPRS